ncbi:MAG: lipopolysaccharide biosynthesis protein [Candidatus Saganbacteria bacterium]|uniref:Lipopolysaccharide biosynthesis protein n=1 Tax=Candidatus Saganbacteria bacterium TaxID=2575572 RepID=A0A833NSS7_UNCSA|nr:MAG: lipopolysaccharide biosynthesis protein [Candidatus Saganbacteria bacterium]
MDDEINLVDYIKIISKRKLLISCFIIFSVVFSYIQVIRVPKMYKAEVSFLSMGSSAGGLAAFAASSFGGGGAVGGTSIEEILKSRAMAKLIAQNNDLKKIIFKNKWDSKNNLWIGEEPTLDDVSSALKSGLESGDDKKIVAVSTDPEIAAIVANAYAKGLIAFLNQKAIGINLQVLDEAVPPQTPANKDIKTNIFVGALMGLFIGVLLAFFLEYFENIRIKSY